MARVNYIRVDGESFLSFCLFKEVFIESIEEAEERPVYTVKFSSDLSLFFWGGGEGPRSRCYGHTSALRLIVQPSDEDD